MQKVLDGKPRIATVNSCFDLVGSRQHGVATERSKATGWLTDLLLNAHGNVLR